MTKPRKEFVGLLKTAADNAELVAKILRQRGESIRILPHSVSPNVEERWEHVDDGDLEITDPDGTIGRIELKHWPELDFHNMESIPYSNIIVDEAYKIDKAHSTPLHSYMILNASRTGYVLIPASTKNHWFKESKVDGRENTGRLYYFCKKQFLSFEKLIEKPVEPPPRADGKPKPTRAIGLVPGAMCGSFACNGCYDVGDDKQFHPPRPGYRQQDLMDLDDQ